MKKTLAIILALVMCLSVGMTVFAVSSGDVAVGDDEEFVNNVGETDVDILVMTSNISVTVPLDVVIVADVIGGDCFVPSNYCITNNSLIDVDVVNVKVSQVKDNWNLVDAAKAANAAPTGAANDLYMTVNGVSLLDAFTADGVGVDWTVTAAQKTLDLPLAASTSMLNTTERTDEAVTIVYTVAAAE